MHRSLTTEAAMATPNDPLKTFLSQGKFIYPEDRKVYEARARVMRAEAMQQSVRTVGRVVRSWFARPGTAARSPSHARAHAA
jgi:hypothetical protein